MALCSIRAQCKTCQAPRLFQKEGTSNVLHLLLSVITFGFWLFIWIAMAVANAFKPFRCTTCGQPKLR